MLADVHKLCHHFGRGFSTSVFYDNSTLESCMSEREFRQSGQPPRQSSFNDRPLPHPFHFTLRTKTFFRAASESSEIMFLAFPWWIPSSSLVPCWKLNWIKIHLFPSFTWNRFGTESRPTERDNIRGTYSASTVDDCPCCSIFHALRNVFYADTVGKLEISSFRKLHNRFPLFN